MGRASTTVAALPTIFPVNYAVLDGDVVFRTDRRAGRWRLPSRKRSSPSRSLAVRPRSHGRLSSACGARPRAHDAIDSPGGAVARSTAGSTEAAEEVLLRVSTEVITGQSFGVARLPMWAERVVDPGPSAHGFTDPLPHVEDRSATTVVQGAVMKALVYHGPGHKAWEEVAEPTLVDDTDAIVRVDATTICGTDLHILKGDVPAVDRRPDPRPRGRRHRRRRRHRREDASRSATGCSCRASPPAALPVLPRGPLRAVPRRRRLDPRPHDRRHPGRVRPRAVRRHVDLPVSPPASATSRS